jgi:hypothetical protein
VLVMAWSPSGGNAGFSGLHNPETTPPPIPTNPETAPTQEGASLRLLVLKCDSVGRNRRIDPVPEPLTDVIAFLRFRGHQATILYRDLIG